MDEGRKSCPLTDKYKVKADNDEAKNWVRLLDFESPIKSESDWYNTETFQVFLDALDINQPTQSHRQPSKSNKDSFKNDLGLLAESPRESTIKELNNDKSRGHLVDVKQERAEDKRVVTSKQNDKPKQEQTIQFETILSAEALKILSDLPDLSHMSATRSFIFPASTVQPQKTKSSSNRR